jgi:uncharacterized protein (TIRG00374 family)
MSKKTKRAVKATVSLSFFVFLFYFVNTRNLVETVKSMDVTYLLLSLVLAAVMVASSCLKWKVSVKLTGANVRFSRICSIYLIGYYFSNLLPSNIGGDVVRSYYLGRSLKSQPQAAASVVLERFSGVLFLLLLTVFTPLLHVGGYRSPYLAFPALGAAGLLVAFVIFTLIRDPLGRCRTLSLTLHQFLHLSPTCWTARLADRMLHVVGSVYDKCADAIREARRDRAALIKMVLLTVWFYFLTWVNVYWAFRTFGASPTFAEVAAVTPAIMVVSMIPISLGSLGLAEGAYVLYFSMIGMASSDALAVGLFMRFKVLLIGVIGVWFYLLHKHEVNRDMLQQAEDAKHE